MKKSEKIAEQFFQLSVTLKQECIKYLERYLKKRKNYIVDFDNCDYSITVAYDGGNHPEYASNVFSTVESVLIKDNDIYVDTEDGRISVDCLSTEELYDICSYIDENKHKLINID